MTGSPSSVLTMGLGDWGSVNLLTTLGYGIPAAVAETGPPYRTWEARNQGRVFESRPQGRTWEAR